MLHYFYTQSRINITREWQFQKNIKNNLTIYAFLCIIKQVFISRRKVQMTQILWLSVCKRELL